MSVLKGNLPDGGSFTIPVQANSYVFQSIIITNTASAVLTVNLVVTSLSGTYRIAPANLQLDVGTSYIDKNIQIQLQETVTLTVSGSTADYYFYFTSP